ncbi:P-loop containing nucleoside triphosphate hydrolase protein [Clohesyomyces aquaticus]|uniref:p-loop containing nucleoside triphosphate hydrolase protein n=1 Tax=Clohesyomyces aquaticus TaxID=1231657 RepID=A0A1Y1ZZ77_9PLEO|nr:P-loop containing nucleoside triphosphate hydrolase protein [Clohesyomyces aquaticus]
MALRFFREYKVVVAGGERVGKSSFVYRFAPGYGIGMYDPRTIAIVDDEVALFDILDTAAQEEYSALRRQYMRDLEGMIIMYSITSRESFKETENFWKQLLCVKNKAYSPMLLVGNKSDRHGERQVSAQEGMALAKQFGCGFLEASAKEGCNVERAFHEIVREIRRFDSNVTTLSPLPETYQGSSSIFSKGILLSLLKVRKDER